MGASGGWAVRSQPQRCLFPTGHRVSPGKRLPFAWPLTWSSEIPHPRHTSLNTWGSLLEPAASKSTWAVRLPWNVEERLFRANPAAPPSHLPHPKCICPGLPSSLKWRHQMLIFSLHKDGMWGTYRRGHSLPHPLASAGSFTPPRLALNKLPFLKCKITYTVQDSLTGLHQVILGQPPRKNTKFGS